MRARQFVRSLTAFVFAATCFGSVAVRAAEMSFHIVQLSRSDYCGRGCVQVIAGEGEITANTPEAFASYAANIDANHARNVLFLDSPGGNVVGSLEFGKVLRRLGTTVVVARVLSGPDGAGAIIGGRCMSACAYALMGGARRVVPPESRVGIHRMFRKEEAYDYGGRTTTHYIYAPDAMVAALTQYSDSMGISPKLVSKAERISPQSVHIVTRSELRRWHLGNTRF